jgi:tRNA(Arg) A34 adenosine deaminase TadA
VVVAFVHGTFETETDETRGELVLGAAVVDEEGHVALYFVMDVLDAQYLLQHQVLPLEHLGQR